MRKIGLLIVDHGSRVDEANELLAEVVRLVKDMSQLEIVHYAHMELAEPTIQQGFDTCVKEGAEEIVVHPYFLVPGRHSTEDIPRMAAHAAQKHPKISFRVTPPLGLDRKIGELILKRVQEDDPCRK